MSATISLEVHGMCIVKEAGPTESQSTVISVNPDVDPNHVTDRRLVPPLKTYLVFTRTTLASTGGKLPAIKVAGPDYSAIDDTMFSIELPEKTTVSLSSPNFGVHPPWVVHPPITFADLRLSALPANWGTGAFNRFEGCRLLLPAEGHSGWGDPLGTYVFAANPGEMRQVADLFFWSAHYDSNCRISLVSEDRSVDGFVELEGTAKVRFACYCSRRDDAFRGSRNAFDFHTCLSSVCGCPSVSLPQLVTTRPFHVGSGSCPPIKP